MLLFERYLLPGGRVPEVQYAFIIHSTDSLAVRGEGGGTEHVTLGPEPGHMKTSQRRSPAPSSATPVPASPIARRLPFGEKHTEVARRKSAKGVVSLKLAASQSFAPSKELTAAKSFPSGEKVESSTLAMSRTALSSCPVTNARSTAGQWLPERPSARHQASSGETATVIASAGPGQDWTSCQFVRSHS